MMDGVLNINKPEGISSFDAVRYIRRESSTRKVGYAGTLDPAASGVLPVCLGRGTKIIDFIMNQSKTYKVEIKLGMVTDTYDREGSVIYSREVNVSERDAQEAVISFKGESWQVPPMYSALKINGQRLYDLARKGIEVERQPRKINIYNVDILEVKLPLIKFQVECSKGTYMRSLCYDIGEKLGCGAMMNNLLRVSTSQFHIKDAIDLYQIKSHNIESLLIPIDKALDMFPRIEVEDVFARLLCNGVAVKDKRLTVNTEDGKILRVYNRERLLGLGVKNDSCFKIINLLV